LGSIDVVIPAYNAKAFIENALRSAVTQTYRPQRIIVVDDGSKDGTPDIVRAFASRTPQVRIECVEQPNAGPSAARNKGLRMVEADFVALLDADDEWLPTKLEKQLAIYQGASGDEFGLVYCDYGLMNSAGARIPNFGFQLNRRMRGRVWKQLRFANQIAGSASAVLLRTQALREVGLFDETLVCAEDWDLWLRIAERYAIDFVDEELVLLRQHTQNSQNNESRMLGGELLFADKLFRKRQLPLTNLIRLAMRVRNARVAGLHLSAYRQCHPVIRAALSDTSVRTFYQFFRVAKSIRRRWRERFSSKRKIGL
jgi:glycosyltransferase involved in cell wall biosynthesis